MARPAPLLPDGFRRSAWAQFDAHSRRLFLAEVLVARPELIVDGTVDYESAREPVLTDLRSGNLVSLAGDRVGAVSDPLAVDVTKFTPIFGRDNTALFLILGAIAAATIVTVSK